MNKTKSPFKTWAATISFGLAFMLMGACADDYEYNPPQKLAIRQTEVCFSASSQTGVIRLTPTVGLTAHAKAAWCHLQVSNDSTVVVEVERNMEMAGRSTEVVLSSPDGTASVPVTQYGAVWYVMGDSTYLVGDDATTVVIPVHSDYEYTVEHPEWATGKVTADGYEVELKANATRQARRTPLTFRSEKGQRTIAIYQFGPNDIAGTYQLNYGIPISQTENRDTTVTVEIEQSASDSTLFNISGMSVIPQVKLPFTYDPLAFTLTITAGKSLGRVGNQQRYAFTALASEVGAHISSTISYSAHVEIDPLTLMPSFAFADEEGFEYYDAMGNMQMAHIYGILTIGTIQEKASMDADNFLGYADRIMYPVLTKTSQNNEEK